jgi:catechol 2,3-dioxygenase-like lactoylglutathione lyase family enzyme
MTQTSPSRSTEGLGVHSLDHFVLSVSDLPAAGAFYGAFGLELCAEGAMLGLSTAGSAHRWGVLTEGPRKQLQHITFGAFAEDFPRLRDRIEQRGIELLDSPPGFDSDGLWFRDVDGTLLEVRVAEKRSPDRKAAFDNSSAPAGERGAQYRGTAPRIQPRRLSHVLLFTADVGKTIAFYQDILGLRLSDHCGDGIAFMHGIHGSDHHVIAFARSTGPGLHHCSWDVGSVNSIGLGAMQMAAAGFVAGWGLGRHVLGSNYFHYVRDPWGSYAEYSADIDYIPADVDWQSSDHPPEDALHLWGPELPADFVMNYEAERRKEEL